MESIDFLMPPRTANHEGKLRRVGVEIEFGGIGLEEAAEIIVQLHGGVIERTHHFSYIIRNTKYGDFVVESDSRFLSQKRYETYLAKIGVPPHSAFSDNLEKVLEKFAGTLLPFEIAMPPLPLDQLHAAEKIRAELFRHSAQGISSSLFAAFGFQLNPEVPDFEVGTLLSYLRSFFLLYDWLEDESEIALARKVTPYIHPFSQAYVSSVLNPFYRPSIDQFMRDYLEMNPTRNRPLDFLPLFTYMNRDLVFQYPVERKLVKPRPTFHYRLPNSEIDDPTWSFAGEWNKWVQVEKLAANQGRLLRMCEDYLMMHDQKIFVKNPWISRTREWLDGMA